MKLRKKKLIVLSRFSDLILGVIKHYRVLSLTRRGLWFWYKGDEVLLRWPHHRKIRQPKGYIISQQGKYVGSLCEGTSNSLQEMDSFWKEYQEFISYYDHCCGG